MIRLTPTHLRIAAFDMGRRNFAVSIEEISLTDLENFRRRASKIPTRLRTSVKRNLADFPVLQKLIGDVAISGRRIFLQVFDVQDPSEEGFGSETRRRLLRCLDSLSSQLATCTVAILEQQYVNGLDRRTRAGKAGGTANFPALKVGETVATWLAIRLPWVESLFFGAPFKTQILGAPPDLTKPQRKKWAVEEARRILALRGDTEGVDLLRKGKVDDMADALLMTAAFKWKELIVG